MAVVFQLRDDDGFAAGHTAHRARVPVGAEWPVRSETVAIAKLAYPRRRAGGR